LLINSLDATPAGGEVNVVLEHDLAPYTETQRFKVSVQDSGQGIPETVLPNVFEPFVSSKESGTGLGLSVSKQIIEAHHGEVFAANQSGGGAVVGFVIPAITSHASFSHVHA
jgi:signal transduction histidine kinase